MPRCREDPRATARRIRAEQEEEERQTYRIERRYGEISPAQPRYLNGPIFEALKGYQAYPDHRPSPQNKPQRKAPRAPSRGGRGENNHADYARALAVQMGPLEGAQLATGVNLFGPTVREGALVDLQIDHPAFRKIKDQSYKLIKTIGIGGQGHCDLYQNTRDGNHLVCKIMKRGAGDTKESKPLEAAILMDILDTHRHVINLQAYTYTSSLTTFWYEFCPNGDLQDLIDAYGDHRVKVPESFIWHTYKQVAYALAYIHTGYDHLTYDGTGPPRNFRPIVHRDVKPPNVFLRPNSYSKYPDLVLADFGMATTKTRSSERVFRGTPIWQPPEIPIHTAKGDVWSLGACIHAMATGSPPLKPVPRGFKGDWTCEPSARIRADLTKFGYSRQLDDAMYVSMRTDAKDRLMGKSLVKEVRKRYEEWNGKNIALERWALRR